MKHVSAKNKIYGVVFLWLGLSAAALGYAFPKLNDMNAKASQQIRSKSQDLGFLELEQQNFKQAKSDLDKLARETYQPDEFFNRDVNLVHEVKMLEDMGEHLGVKVTLGGLTGTLKDKQKAKTRSEVYIVPFTLALDGKLSDIVGYVETLENLPFLVSTNNISFNSSSGGRVMASLAGNFYIKK